MFISIMILGSLFYSPNLLSFPTRDQFARAVLESIFNSYRGSRLLSRKIAPWKEQVRLAIRHLTGRSGRFRNFSSGIVKEVEGDFASPMNVLQFVESRRANLPLVVSSSAKPPFLLARSANPQFSQEWSRMIAYFMEREAEMLPLEEWRQVRFLIEKGGSDLSLNYLRSYYLSEIERWVRPLLEAESANTLSDIRKPLQEIGGILGKKDLSLSYKIQKIEEVVEAIQAMQGRSPHQEVLIKIKQTLMNFKTLCDAEERGFGWVGNLGELGIADDLWWAELRYGSIERKKLAVIVLIEEDAIQRGRIGFHVLKTILEWPDVQFRRYLSDFIIKKERVPQDIAQVIEALCLQSTQYIPGEAKFNETISTITLMLLNPRMESFGAILGQVIEAKKPGEAHFIAQKIAAIRALGKLETESSLKILIASCYNPNFYSDLQAFRPLFRAYIDEVVSLSLTCPERLSQISEFLRGMYSGLKEPELRRGVAAGLGKIYAGSDKPEVARMFLQMLNEEKRTIVKAELIFSLSKLSFSDEALKKEVVREAFKKMSPENPLPVEQCLAGAIFLLRQEAHIDVAKRIILSILNNRNPQYSTRYLYHLPSEPSLTTLFLEFQRYPQLFEMVDIDRGLRELLSRVPEEVSDRIKVEIVITYAHYGDWRSALSLFEVKGLSIENKRRIIEAAFASENIDPPTFRKMIEKAFSLYDDDLQVNLFDVLRNNGVAVNQKLKILRNDLADTGRLYDALKKKYSGNPFARKVLDELLMAIQQTE